MKEHATKVKNDNYLEQPEGQEEKIKEQMLYGDGDSLVEKEKKTEEYQTNELNE